MGTCCGFVLALRLLAGLNAGFEVLGWVAISNDTMVDGTAVGGLSGLVDGGEPGLFYALSDDGSERSPARFYALRVDLADGHLDPGDVRLEHAAVLKRADGSTYPPQTLDPEGFARTVDGRFFVSSEGPIRAGVPPSVREIAADGSFLRELALPEGYAPRADPPTGVRHNLAFESLTPSADGKLLWTGIENALLQDGPEADLGQRSPSRLLAFDLATGKAVAEHLYWTEPLPVAPIRPDGLKVNGLVDLLALPDGDFLALERAYADGAGFKVRLFRVSLAGATNLLSRRALAGSELADFQPVTKSALLDFAVLGIPMDNYEGLAWGPTLADGRRILLVVADNNFNPLETTWVVALARRW